ncbi:hypothetical protein FHS64_001654 [Brevundimonas terrae]|nr:hypothetical protein [Brevundimonas terrae]
MTVAIRTEIVSALGVERAAQAAVSRLAKSVSPRRMGPDDKQHQGACPAGSYPDVGRMQGSSLRGATTLAVQRKLPQQSADQVMHGGDQKSPSCENMVGLPEQGWRGADDPDPAGIGVRGTPILTQRDTTPPPVDNLSDFNALASSSNSSAERSGTVRTAGGYRNSSNSRSDADTPCASASASRQRLSFRHACHPQSSQYATPPALIAREPVL